MSTTHANGGWDLFHPRPWKAEPMNPERPDKAWKVTCASKSGIGRATVITHVAERDARLMEWASQNEPESLKQRPQHP